MKELITTRPARLASQTRDKVRRIVRAVAAARRRSRRFMSHLTTHSLAYRLAKDPASWSFGIILLLLLLVAVPSIDGRGEGTVACCVDCADSVVCFCALNGADFAFAHLRLSRCVSPRVVMSSSAARNNVKYARVFDCFRSSVRWNLKCGLHQSV